MTERKRTKLVRIRPDRAVFVEGSMRRAGDEVETSIDEAQALVDQRIAEYPDAPLDPDDVAAAEQKRADDEALEQRYAVAVHMDDSMRAAQAREAQATADEEERARLAFEHHLTIVKGNTASAASSSEDSRSEVGA